jgi:hypothetical protein
MISTSLSSRIIARIYPEKTADAASLPSVIDCRALYPDLHFETMPDREKRTACFAGTRPPFA